MNSSNNINIISFNCAGVPNKLPVIDNFCSNYDIIFLQETWLTSVNINILDTVHEDFCSHSVSAVDLGGPMLGRPHGGVSVLWKRSLGRNCSIKTFDDPRVIGLILDNGSRKLMCLNIYLPYFSNDNYDEYLGYVGKISSIIEDYDHNDLMVIGDFNADVNTPFFSEWDSLRETAGLVFADVEKLPGTSYTHVNNASLTKSWLDHCLTTGSVRGGHRSFFFGPSVPVLGPALKKEFGPGPRS